MNGTGRAFVLLLLMTGWTRAAFAQGGRPSVDLGDASLADLMKIEITSASHKEQQLFDTAAAVYVITAEDIRRSGATSIPEALRLAPNLHVARADNNVRVAQLAGDTAFTAWLGAQGLTLAEAARIQVPYVRDPAPIVTTNKTHTPAALPLALGASALAGAWNAFANADGHSRIANVLGFGSGLAAVGLGASQMGRQNVPQAMSLTTAAVGGLSVALSARSLHRHRVIAAAEREAARKSKVADATIAPIIPVGGSGAGVSVSFRF